MTRIPKTKDKNNNKIFKLSIQSLVLHFSIHLFPFVKQILQGVNVEVFYRCFILQLATIARAVTLLGQCTNFK